ncbi:MAG: metallophosphoesterase [SAR324 cluster bacterium]|nr:metallophosphoesterase [SAR324 cluster bacterium]
MIKLFLILTWLAGVFVVWQWARASRIRKLLGLAIGGGLLIELISLVAYFSYIGNAIPEWAYWGVLLGVFFLNPWVCLIGLSRFVKNWFWPHRNIPFSEGRREFLLSGLALGALVSPIPLLKNHRILPLTIQRSIINVPYALPEPVTLIFISDLHLGNFFPIAYFDQLLQILHNEAPDYLILGGDLIDYNHQEIDTYAPQISQWPACCETLAVIGNHDFFGNPMVVASKLERLGVRVLRDQIYHIKGGIPLLGARDFLWEGHHHVSFDYLTPQRPALMISHNPDLTLHLKPWERERLFASICGHTHGGQIVFPGIGVIFTPADKRFTRGFYQLAESGLPMMISAGMGYAGLPIRLNCPPDVLAIKLEGKKEL